MLFIKEAWVAVTDLKGRNVVRFNAKKQEKHTHTHAHTHMHTRTLCMHTHEHTHKGTVKGHPARLLEKYRQEL